MALTLYTNPMSRGRIAHWMMEELGEPYETVYLDYGPAMNTPEHLARNPMGKVPVLEHDGKLVTECAAICFYLADAFPKAGLMPQDRAAGYRWMFFAAGPLEAAVTNRSLGLEVPADKQGFVGYGSYERAIHTLESAVPKTGYIAGDRFSCADVYVGSQIGWGLQFETIPATPALKAYWDRIKDRPALARSNAADDAMMSKE